ncbi:MAG: methyltransferase domain-containing protein [Planctomycetota bacterium]|nr:methyltransferase domain-containing protein [Planctomycetota bacterium]
MTAKGCDDSGTPWFVAAFEGDYLERYAHRSNEAAAREAPFLVRALNAPPGARILDLCCGAGRHSNELAAAGLRVTGVDLSPALLCKAAREHRQPAFVRADMRTLPFEDASFDGVVNLFTSFGYFATDEENLAALREGARVLKAGGRFVQDFFNLKPTLAGLVPQTDSMMGRTQVREQRGYNPANRRLEKVITLRSFDGTTQRRTESVRAFSPGELGELFGRAGLRIIQRFGDMTGAAFDEDASPRCITLGTKA